MPSHPGPLWHIGDGRSLFIGPLGFNSEHHHSVPVLLAGLYAPFRLRLAGREWMTAKAAVIPAGTSYAFDVAGSPLAVLYLEPSVAGVDALAHMLSHGDEIGGALVGNADQAALLRSLFEDRDSAAWTGAALDDLLGVATKRARRAIDPRIARAVRAMLIAADDTQPLADLARSVGLSASRFQHLFSAEVGVPFRRYRAWQRLRTAIREIVAGSSFTEAAHAAGFFDQAHFSRSFRATFGAPASPSLRQVRN